MESSSVKMDSSSLLNPEASSPSAQTCILNLVLLSVSFLFAFIAFSGIQNLESSLDLGEVKGETAVAIIYIVFTVSCFFGKLFVTNLGPKLCILIQEINFVLFIAAQLYPRLWTVYPAAALVGIGASAMWVAQGEYITFLSIEYARRKNRPDGDSLGLFQGIFFGIYQLSQIVGNLVSSLVLHSHGSDSDKTPKHTTHMLFIVYIICISVGILILLVGVKRPSQLKSRRSQELSTNEPDQTNVESFSLWVLLGETVSLFVTPQMTLLIPMFFANGVASGFIWGDFTGTIITDSVRKANIGFIMAVFGAVDVVCSFGFGKLSDVIGRPPLIFLGFLSHGGAVLWLIFKETPEDAYFTLYTLAAIFGVGDAVWNTIISATIAGCFKDKTEGAFSNFKMWQSSGVAAAFFYNNKINLDTKLYILIGSLGAALVCYVVNIVVFKFERKSYQI